MYSIACMLDSGVLFEITIKAWRSVSVGALCRAPAVCVRSCAVGWRCLSQNTSSQMRAKVKLLRFPSTSLPILRGSGGYIQEAGPTASWHLGSMSLLEPRTGVKRLVQRRCVFLAFFVWTFRWNFVFGKHPNAFALLENPDTKTTNLPRPFRLASPQLKAACHPQLLRSRVPPIQPRAPTQSHVPQPPTITPPSLQAAHPSSQAPQLGAAHTLKAARASSRPKPCAIHPAHRAPKTLSFAGPQLGAACHPSSLAPSLFLSKMKPQTLLFGEKRTALHVSLLAI